MAINSKTLFCTIATIAVLATIYVVVSLPKQKVRINNDYPEVSSVSLPNNNNLQSFIRHTLNENKANLELKNIDIVLTDQVQKQVRINALGDEEIDYSYGYETEQNRLTINIHFSEEYIDHYRSDLEEHILAHMYASVLYYSPKYLGESNTEERLVNVWNEVRRLIRQNNE